MVLSSINKKFIFIFLLIVIVLTTAYFYIAYSLTNKTQSIPKTKEPVRYGRLSTVSLTKTNKDKLLQIMGDPAYQEDSGSSTKLFFNSSDSEQFDYFWIKNSKTIASRERLAQTENLKTLRDKIGKEDFVAYDVHTELGLWYVYLKLGLALYVNEELIVDVVRFIPQDKNTFFTELAPKIGITNEKSTPQIEPL